MHHQAPCASTHRHAPGAGTNHHTRCRYTPPFSRCRYTPPCTRCRYLSSPITRCKYTSCTMQQVLVEQDSGFWCGAECREAEAMLVQVARTRLDTRFFLIFPVHCGTPVHYNSVVHQFSTPLHYTSEVYNAVHRYSTPVQNTGIVHQQADIKCADGVLRPKSFCKAKIDEIND